MGLLCNDVDLMVLEPSLFWDGGAQGQRLIYQASATLAGTTLTLGGGSLTAAGVTAGMVATIGPLDDSSTGAWEITEVTSAMVASVSVVRVEGDAAVAPTLSAPVKVTVYTYRPQIAVISRELLGMLGVEAEAYAEVANLRAAAVFGTLALIHASLTARESDGKLQPTKRDHYAAAYAALRRAVVAKVDLDGDGVAETRVSAGVRRLERA